MTASNMGMARQWTIQTEGPTTDKTLQKAAPRSLQLVLLSMMTSTHGFDRLGRNYTRFNDTLQPLVT